MVGTLIGTVVRTVMATFGGTLIAQGMVSDSDWQAIGGAAVTLVVGAWGIFQKYQAKNAK